MHVLFDGRLLHRSTSGLERVQYNLLRQLAARDEVTRLAALVMKDGGLVDALPANVERRVVATTEDILAVLLPEDAADRPDVYHMSYFPDRNPRDLLLLAAARSSVVSVTDAILNRHPEYHRNRREFEWYDRFVRELVRNADRVLSYTESAGREAVDDLGVDSAKVDTASLAVDHRLTERLSPHEVTKRLAKWRIEGDYFVAVGKDYPHKDHKTVVRALARLTTRARPVRVICAGQRVWHDRDARGAAGEPLDALIERLGVAARLHWLQGLDDDDVKAVIQGSKGLLYPSREEGFGLPPLEAMTLGVPVAAANAMSIPEVVGSGALLFEPGDDAQLAEHMRTLLTDEDATRALVQRGEERAARFTWQRAADGVISCYARAAAIGRSRGDAATLDGDAVVRSLALLAHSPFNESSDVAAWQDRCFHTDAHLQDVKAHRDELEEQVRQLRALAPRWSLRRRIQKLRRRFGDARGK